MATQCYKRVWMSISILLREVSGPDRCVGVWILKVVSKPHIWDHGASAVSLGTQPTFQTTGDGKGSSPTYLNPTICWCHFSTRFSSFIDLRDAEVLRY